jgi:glycosyltransferase involved in cell wall biosynthesis
MHASHSASFHLQACCFAPGNRGEVTVTAYDAPVLVLAHQFALTSLTGVTVLLRALLPEIGAVNPRIRVVYLNFDEDAMPGASLTRLWDASRHRLEFVGINLHIERYKDRSIECFEVCRRIGVPAYLWAHDYWPQHERILRKLVEELGVTLLASTPTVRDGLAQDNFSAEVVQVGISLENLAVGTTRPPQPAPFVVGTAGRLVTRKRQIDVVRAFQLAHFDETVELRLRLLPSLVYPADVDGKILDEVMEEVTALRAAGATVVVDHSATTQHDYGVYSAFVCPSDYEGFSMTPIEAIYCGCPTFMSDIPAHRATARMLHPDDWQNILFPVGDVSTLAALMRDEALTRRREARLQSRLSEIRSLIEAQWSVQGMARALLDTLGRLSPGVYRDVLRE